MTDVILFDETTQTPASITVDGELVVGPVSYSTAYHVTVDIVDTAFEIVPANGSLKFIITSMLLASSKTYASATTSETLTIYEANPADLDTNLRTAAQIDFLRNDRLVATSLNIATSASVSLVASAADIDVSVTIAGYYVRG